MNSKYIRSLSIFLALVMILGSVFVGVPGIAFANSTNLLINGDFEEWNGDSPIGWFGSKSNITRSNVLKVEGDAQSGDTSLRLKVTGTTHQRFTTQPISIGGGVNYTLTYWVKGSGEIRNAYVVGTSYSVYSAYTIVNSDEWQQVQYNFSYATDANDVEIIFSARNTKDTSHIQIDNVVLVSDQQPEPPTKVAQVTAIPGSGEVDENTSVSLSTATEGATIYYTTDGSDPNVDSTTYTDPIVITEALTIKSIAVKESMDPSDISIFVYTIKPPISIEPIATARVKPNGEEVIVQGIVTGLIGNNAFIQDDTAGIYLYNGGTSKSELVVGNIVKVKGKLNEFNNLKQMENNIIQEVVSTGNKLPTPFSLTVAGITEEYESRLVKVSNLTIKTIPAPTTNSYSIIATDGTKDIELRVDRYLNPPITLPLEGFEVGDNIIVTAPVGQYKENYQLMIRAIDDIAKKGITAENLFISEYIEGSSNNKAIEIFNGTGNVVDLSRYKVELYSNGATIPGSTQNLSGTLNHGDVYVIAHSSAVQEIKDKANITSGVVNFNGDDAIVLKHNDEIIDVFGQVGFDPGTGWGEGNITVDHTLVRKASITGGDINPDDEFDPTLEWDVYPRDTFIYLGSHTMGEELDTTAPVIVHTPVTEGNINEDLTIKATVTDNKMVESVKLYYRAKGEESYIIANMALTSGEYSYIILKESLSGQGLEYYIEASDGTNISTSPENTNAPYEVTISADDILPPKVTNLIPASGSSTGANLRPEISAEYSDESDINTESIRLYLDDVDVTSKATITESKITYIPNMDLLEGNHTAKVIVSDNAPTPQTSIVEWSFYVGEREFNFYFGQLHSHTNISDGQGTPDDAYSWARDRGNADFFAVTDHSNWFDNEKDLSNENITDVSQSTSNAWKTLNNKANQYNKDNEYVALAGYEMTWSGSTGGWGHINTFNTPWFASRSNSKMNLQAYYNKIAEWPESINQLNHPGKTFGDFGDFGFYSERVDNVVQLIEVGNGEGPVRGSGYFPSYEYYTRALDKGWHLAPTNNQDNHKGNWITSNEARTVIISDNLTRDSIYDGIRDMRVYSTENKNLEIMYTVNDQIMGSKLSSPDKLNFSININEPDVADETQKISRVDIISNGGAIVKTQNFNSHNVDWNFELDPIYDYYYVKVTQANKDISVTSPVWVGEVLPVGLSGLEASKNYFELGNSIDLSATVYNNGNNILSNAKVEFYVGSISEGNKIGEATVTNIGQGSTGKATITWAPEKAGDHNLYAVATITGADKQFTASIKVEVVVPGSAVKVMIDYAHRNHYVSGGDYANRIESFKEMLKGKNMIMVENHNEFTDEALNDIDILVITSPQPIDRGAIPKAKLSDEEIQVVKRFTDRGGSLILTSRANYSDGTGDYQNSVQGNKLLNAIGSNVIFNSDQVIDNTKNGGQAYRLYLETYTSEKFNLTPGLTKLDLYSFYSGCSVLLKDGGNNENVDFLVKGHPTTKNDNAGKVEIGHIPLQEGNVYVIAAEELPSGGKLIISGSTFFSDFEMSGDSRYSNIDIASNILEWLKPEENIELKTIKELRDGMPSNFGQRFAIEGRITSMSEAYSKEHNLNNAFFEVIYVQDETGGMTVFGVSNTKLPLGTKVRIIGTAGQYEGDYQLQISNELEDLIIVDDGAVEIAPKEMSTLDSMKKSNEGWLVKVRGIVTRIDLTDNSLYIDDGSGEARVYVNGYIGDGSGDTDKLGKWDPSIKLGDMVSAIGLASTDPVGPRLRVRNTAEIIKEKVVEHEYPLSIRLVEKVVKENTLTVKVNVENHTEGKTSGVIIIKLIDDNGRAYKVVYKNATMVKGQNLVEFNLNLENYSKGIKEIKVYIWDSLDNMKPLSEVK